MVTHSNPHDSYAATYDDQVRQAGCHIASDLFDMVREHIRPGQHLLDCGIGSGLSAEAFARAGLVVSGMDVSPSFLEICRGKGFAADLKLHDLQKAPWPYSSSAFDLLIACGVFHFIPSLREVIFEARRLLRPGGIFVFTTRVPDCCLADHHDYSHKVIDGFDIYDHNPFYISTLLQAFSFQMLKQQDCYVGTDAFQAWSVRKSDPAAALFHTQSRVR